MHDLFFQEIRNKDQHIEVLLLLSNFQKEKKSNLTNKIKKEKILRINQKRIKNKKNK